MRQIFIITILAILLASCTTQRHASETETIKSSGIQLKSGETEASYEAAGPYVRVLVVDKKTRRVSELAVYISE